MISPTLIRCLYTKCGNTDIRSQGKCKIFKWDHFYYNFVLFDLNCFSQLNSDRLFEPRGTWPHSLLNSSERSHGCCGNSSDAKFSPSSIHPTARLSAEPHTCSWGTCREFNTGGEPSASGGWYEQMLLPFFPWAVKLVSILSAAKRSQPPTAVLNKDLYSPVFSLLSHLTSKLTSQINNLNISLFLRLCFQWHPYCDSLKAQIQIQGNRVCLAN